MFSYFIFIAVSCDIDNTKFYISGYTIFCFLTFMFVYKYNFLLLRTSSLWFERVATFVFVLFNLRVKPIFASITVIEFMIHFIGRTNKVSMYLTRAKWFAQTNILTSFLSLSKSSTGINNSTLPSPKGVYTQILILYNFCILIIKAMSSSCCCRASIRLFTYLLSRFAWFIAGCSQAVIVSYKQLYLDLRIFNTDS